MNRKIKANISISRSSNDMINFTLRDEASGIQFVDMKMTMVNYAQLITGLSHVEIEGEVRGLANVGKRKIRESRSAICPLDTYDKERLREWLFEFKAEDGWQIDAYLGSQNSIKHIPEGKRLNYSVYKFVEDDQP